jgi:tetratricopeptide (TPR) repeat protein
MTLFDLPWQGRAIPFAALSCWENVYPPIAAEARRMGARFGVHLTSESEVGGVVHEHTLRVCILRAVENRLPYVRAANTGISCFIDSRGRVMNILSGPGGETTVAGVLVDRVGLADERLTLHTRSRGAFEKTCTLVGLGLLLGTFVRRRPAATVLAVVALTAIASGCGRTTDGTSRSEDSRAALEAARRLAYHGQLDAAVREYAEACAVESTCRDALGPAATILRKLDDTETGLAFFGSVSERHRALRAEALGYRAFFLERKKLYAESRKCFEEAIEAGASPQVRALYGDLLRLGGELREAEREYRETIRLGLDEPRLRSRLAGTIRAQGRNEEAIRILEPAVAEHAGFSPAWVELGRARLGLGDRAGAVTAFEKAIETEPSAVEARFMLAKLAFREGRNDDAERYAREIASIEATLGRGPRED